MNQDNNYEGTEKPEMSLTRKLTALADGLNVYSGLQKDEEIILIPFSFSLYGTARTVKDFAQTYLDELNHNECREVLDIDFGKMTSVDYWLNKCDKLKRDMEALGTVPMKEHGFTVTLIDFTPAFTTDISKAIVDIIMEVVEMLRVIYQKLDNAPLSLYGNFYRYQKSLYDRHPVEARYKEFKRDAGVLTFDSLMDKQAFEIEECLKKKLLRHTRVPSGGEVAQMNLEMMYKHLPYGYVIPEELKKCYARFFRFVLKDGDMLRLDYDLYGNYLFQYFYQLSEAERQALIELDIMLELINEDMMAMSATHKCEESLPEVVEFHRNCELFDDNMPLSALFFDKKHEDLRTIIGSWRPYLIEVNPEEDALCLSTFNFDLKRIQPSTVYIDFAHLIIKEALIVHMSDLAAYMFRHSNLSKSENSLYVQLKRYKNICEPSKKKGKKRRKFA